MFTRRHYELIARAIARTDRYADDTLIGELLVANLIDMLEADDACFDTYKFLKACRCSYGQ